MSDAIDQLLLSHQNYRVKVDVLYAKLDILESEVRRFSHNSLNFIIFVWAYIIPYNHRNITVITKWKI